MWWKYWCSGQMARGYFDHNQLLVCGILNSIYCWCDGLWCVLSELVFVAGLVCVGCLNQKELWMWWSVPCIACVRCLNQNELWMWWSVLCIAGTGVCGRLGARGVFQSEWAAGCAAHAVPRQNRRGHPGNSAAYHGWNSKGCRQRHVSYLNTVLSHSHLQGVRWHRALWPVLF